MANKAKSKRTNGDGTVWQVKGKDGNPTGRYAGQITAGYNAKGKPVRPTVYGESYEEVRKKLDELKYLRDKKKLPTNPGKMTVADFTRHYYLNVVDYKKDEDDSEYELKNSTWNWYMEMHNAHIATNLGTVRLSKFDRKRAREFFKGLEKTLAHSSMKGVKSTLNRALEYAVEEKIIIDNPLAGLKLPNKQREREDINEKPMPKLIEKDDLAYIMQKLYEYRQNPSSCGLYGVVMTAIYTGMRCSEILGIRIRDVDLETGILTVRVQSAAYISRDDKGKIKEHINGVGSVKSGESVRDLEMGNLLSGVLADRLKYLKSLNKPELLEPDAILFSNRLGGIRTYSGTRTIFVRFMEEIGLGDKGITFHMFRHSFISHEITAGTNKEIIRLYVGHKTSKTTDQFYIHLTREGNKAAAEAIDRQFSEAG
jgi:integrase